MKNCRNTSKQKIFVFEEKSSKLSLVNTKQIQATKVYVDGCEISDNGLRCDFMLLAQGFEYFIELKGQDILHAIKQIKRTIHLLGNQKAKGRISYIICSRSPLTSTEIQSYDRELRKDYQSRLVVKSSPHIDNF